jgi:hypothetical protein
MARKRKGDLVDLMSSYEGGNEDERSASRVEKR